MQLVFECFYHKTVNIRCDTSPLIVLEKTHTVTKEMNSNITVDSRLSVSLTHVVNYFFFFKLMNVHQPLVRTELLARRLRIATTVSHVQQDGRGKTAMKVLCNSIVWQGSTIN